MNTQRQEVESRTMQETQTMMEEPKGEQARVRRELRSIT